MIMREILFRGKRIDNGEWWYGLPLRTLNKDGEDVLNIQCWDRDEDGVTGVYDPVTPATIGQYTGMTDMNGKKIFEGDVVKFTTNRFDISDIGVVCFNKGAFCVKYTSWGKVEFHRIGTISEFQDMGARFNLTYQYAVLGNIFDNPELLEVADNA